MKRAFALLECVFDRLISHIRISIWQVVCKHASGKFFKPVLFASLMCAPPVWRTIKPFSTITTSFWQIVLFCSMRRDRFGSFRSQDNLSPQSRYAKARPTCEKPPSQTVEWFLLNQDIACSQLRLRDVEEPRTVGTEPSRMRKAESKPKPKSAVVLFAGRWAFLNLCT